MYIKKYKSSGRRMQTQMWLIFTIPLKIVSTSRSTTIRQTVLSTCSRISSDVTIMSTDWWISSSANNMGNIHIKINFGLKNLMNIWEIKFLFIKLSAISLKRSFSDNSVNPLKILTRKEKFERKLEKNTLKFYHYKKFE